MENSGSSCLEASNILSVVLRLAPVCKRAGLQRRKELASGYKANTTLSTCVIQRVIYTYAKFL